MARKTTRPSVFPARLGGFVVEGATDSVTGEAPRSPLTGASRADAAFTRDRRLIT
jgi:hypothetical protein